jgi:hypothetical protein
VKVQTEITLTLNEDEARALALDLNALEQRGQLGALRRLVLLRDILTDRGLGVHHRTHEYKEKQNG